MSQKDRERINAVCQTLPGAEVSDPWGGGKMFAGIAAQAPYFHRSRILLPFDTRDDALRHRLVSDALRADGLIRTFDLGENVSNKALAVQERRAIKSSKHLRAAPKASEFVAAHLP